MESISGELAYVNEQVYKDLLDEGWSTSSAASGTPFGKLLRGVEYSDLEFNEATLVLTGRRGHQ